MVTCLFSADWAAHRDRRTKPCPVQLVAENILTHYIFSNVCVCVALQKKPKIVGHTYNTHIIEKNTCVSVIGTS